MTIIFICGSLEPGRDGVGDYTRKLACELKRQGQNVAAIALNDRYVSEDLEGVQLCDGCELPVLRISSGYDSRIKFLRAKNYINRIGPDWISIQFVLYAFHDKGLPFETVTMLSCLHKKCRWHIMFHETWIGAANFYDWKAKIIAGLQKTIIKKLLHQIQPAAIYCTIPFTSHQIKCLGYTVRDLPLFSNITVQVKSELESDGMFRVGLFGQVACNDVILRFLKSLDENILSDQLEMEVLLIGGDPAKMHLFGTFLENDKRFHKRVTYTGFLHEEALSAALHSCTIGLTPVPRHALGKSSTVAAFLAHKIPVAAPVVHKGFSAIGFSQSILVKSIITEPVRNHIVPAGNSVAGACELISLSNIAGAYVYDFTHASSMS